MKAKLLLLGYSGQKNFGDDLLLKQAYDAFHSIAEIHIHTSSLGRESDYLSMWFPGARIFKCTRLTNQYLKGFSHILYFGGGVFFDYNRIGFRYYLRKKISILKNYTWTKYKGIHFAGIGIGLGPFTDAKSEALCFMQLKNFDYLNVRDAVSLALCKKNRLINISLTEDLSLADFHYYQSLKIPISNRKNRIIICPRKYPHGKNRGIYLKNLLSVCCDLKSKGKEILVYGFQSDHDEVIVEEFSKNGYQTKIWNPDTMSLLTLLNEFADCELIITARMHGLYIAGMLDVPVIGIGVHPKLKLASHLFSRSLCVADTFETEEMHEYILQLPELPENDRGLLSKKEEQCKEQYEFIKKWILAPQSIWIDKTIQFNLLIK